MRAKAESARFVGSSPDPKLQILQIGVAESELT